MIAESVFWLAIINLIIGSSAKLFFKQVRIYFWRHNLGCDLHLLFLR